MGGGASSASTGAGNPPLLASASVATKSKRKVPPKIGSSSANIQGSLSRNVVRNEVRDRRSQINNCFKRRLKSKPNLEGKLVVQFEIERSGRVGSVRIIESTIDDAPLEECVRGRFEGWSFAKHHGGSITVRYPFIFRSP